MGNYPRPIVADVEDRRLLKTSADRLNGLLFVAQVTGEILMMAIEIVDDHPVSFFIADDDVSEVEL